MSSRPIYRPPTCGRSMEASFWGSWFPNCFLMYSQRLSLWRETVASGQSCLLPSLLLLPPGTSESATYKEKFIKVDNENFVKEAAAIEGGFLNFGFLKYMVRFEIIGKEDATSIIRSTIEYEVEEKHASNASLVSTSALAEIAEAITRYIKERKSLGQAPEQASG
ncbi:hypothetical protein EJB05_44577 [Eragrostis curvula]|uniref:Bet v I/Major latex protein domain-containing protein n=1 Tax=Eragrostis curvula TaxID=38414 RepID=A0A5J9THX1_9POAL|nr:hypothetical protein EJB05_44577 [Eragrostis curvula]